MQMDEFDDRVPLRQPLSTRTGTTLSWHDDMPKSRTKVSQVDDSSDPYLVEEVNPSGYSRWAPLEGPKVALETNIFRSIFCYGLVMHTVALGATMGITQLSFRNIYWADEGRWRPKWFLFGLDVTASNNLMQFVAKIHEIFIVASLSLMVFHIMRRMMIGRSVPLGLVSGAYQVGSAEYFFSPTYLSPLLWSIRRSNLRVFSIATLLGLSIIYANMVGPSSAVAIIPNLDWHPVFNPFDGQPLMAYTNFLTTSNGFGTDLSLMYNEDCADSIINGDMDAYKCPSGGHDALFDFTNAYAGQQTDFQVSMAEPVARTRRVVLGNATVIEATKSSLGFATTHVQAMTRLVGTFWQYIVKGQVGTASGAVRPRFHVKDGPVYAPLVQVECHTLWGNDTALKNGTVEFKYDNIRLFDAIPGARPALKAVVPKRNRTIGDIHVDWVVPEKMTPDEAYKNGYRGSIGAVVKLPTGEVPLEDGFVKASDVFSVACLVDARWAAADMAFDPNNDDLVTNNLTSQPPFDFLNGSPDMGADARAKYGISDHLNMSRWINKFDTRAVYTDKAEELVNSTSVASLFSPFVYFYANETEDTLPYYHFFPPGINWTGKSRIDDHFLAETSKTVSAVLSMALADAIARNSLKSLNLAASNGTSVDSEDVTMVDLQWQAEVLKETQDKQISAMELRENYTKYDFVVERYGWGYGLENPTTQFGVVVLLIHAGLLVIYLLYLAVFRLFLNGWTSEAWADLGELLSLALLSRPPVQLKHSGAGIDSWRTWRYNLRVRESGEAHNQLELLVGSHKELHEKNEHGMGVRRGKEYS